MRADKHDRAQRKALKKTRRLGQAARWHLGKAAQVGLSSAGAEVLRARDDAIRVALSAGCSWDDIIFGPGTGCFYDLYEADERSLRERFGAADGGLIEEQKRHNELLAAIDREDAHHLGRMDVYWHLTSVRVNLEKGRAARLVATREGRWPSWDADGAAYACALIAPIIRRLEGEEDDDEEEWGWTPETKAEYWAGLEALERRIVAAILAAAPKAALADLIDDLARFALGSRKANLAEWRPPALSEADLRAPTYSDCYKAGLAGSLD